MNDNQQILKQISESMAQTLTLIAKALNGGPGSGNHNPGQGRGVGKPGNGGSHSGGSFSKGSSKTSKESSGKLSKEHKKNLDAVNEQFKSSIKKLEAEYDDMSRRLGEVEDDFAEEYDDGGYDEYGHWQEPDYDSYGDEQLSSSREAAEEFDNLIYKLKSIQKQYEEKSNKDTMTKEGAEKLLDSAHKIIEKYQDNFPSEIEIEGTISHVGDELYDIKIGIEDAQKALKND